MFSVSSGRGVTLAGVVTCGSVLQAVVYDDDRSHRRAAAVIVERCGMEIVDVGGEVSDLVGHVQALQPDLIVLELAMVGTAGLDVVPALLAAVPGTAVVLLSPFSGLRDAALGAGAYDLVDGDDLRELRRCVRRLVPERLAGEAQQEGPVAVDQVAAVGPGEGLGDWEAEPGAAPAIEADEAFEDPVGHSLGNA